MREKYQATLVGCAIGDTLGMPVETWPKQRIERYFGRITEPRDPIIPKDQQRNELKEDEFGKIKLYFKHLKKGDYTDDTILTLALAESLAEKGFDLFDIAQRQLHEYTIRKMPDGTYSGGFGGTTRDAFENLLKGVSPLESGIIGGPGNAPPMKMAPLGLYMRATETYPEGLDFAEKIGKITHLDPRSLVSGVLQAYAVFALLNNIERQDFVRYTTILSEKLEKPLTDKFTWHKSGNITSRLEWISNNIDASAEEAFSFLGNSSAVYKSYPFALFMFQKYWDNPIEGLLETVNYGGDCDTTGAMYGSLAGAKNGMIFPESWVKVTKGIDKAINLGNKLYELGGKR